MYNPTTESTPAKFAYAIPVKLIFPKIFIELVQFDRALGNMHNSNNESTDSIVQQVLTPCIAWQPIQDWDKPERMPNNLFQALQVTEE